MDQFGKFNFNELLDKIIKLMSYKNVFSGKSLSVYNKHIKNTMINMRFALNFCVKNVNNGWKKIHNDNNNIVTQKRNIFEVMYIFSIYNPIPILWSPRTIEGLFSYKIEGRKIMKFFDFMSHIKMRSKTTVTETLY